MEKKLAEQFISTIIKALEKDILTVIKSGTVYNLGYDITYNPTTQTITLGDNTSVVISPVQVVTLDALILQVIDKQETQETKALIGQLQSAITIIENIQRATTKSPIT